MSATELKEHEQRILRHWLRKRHSAKYKSAARLLIAAQVHILRTYHKPTKGQ